MFVCLCVHSSWGGWQPFMKYDYVVYYHGILKTDRMMNIGLKYSQDPEADHHSGKYGGLSWYIIIIK